MYEAMYGHDIKYNSSIAYVNIFNDGRFNYSMWVLPKFVLVYGFKMQVLYVAFFFLLQQNEKKKAMAASLSSPFLLH